MPRHLVPHAGPGASSPARPSARLESWCAAPEARQRLAQQNLGFVIRLASEYRGLGLPLEDLISEGTLGLMEAALRYDPGRGAKFVTYAAAWVRKSILRALSQHTRTIRVPTYHLEQMRRYQRTEARLSTQLGRRPDRDEMSRGLDAPLSRVDAMLRRRITEVSLDAIGPGGDQGPGVGAVRDPHAEDPEQELLRDENHYLVEQALCALSERERLVIVARFGLSDERCSSLRELGAGLGLSRERVRQIEERAKQKIRVQLEKKLLCRRIPGSIIPRKVASARQSKSPRGERG